MKEEILKLIDEEINEAMETKNASNFNENQIVIECLQGLKTKVSQIDCQVMLNEPEEIKPGQIWLDKDNVWSPGYDGEMAYIIKSKEPDTEWDLVCFQEWTFGGYMREGFNEKEIRRMQYLGHIKDIRRVSA